MKPGKTLDALVATTLMRLPKGKSYPKFSTDLNEAWKIVKKVTSTDQWYFELATMEAKEGVPTHYFAAFVYSDSQDYESFGAINQYPAVAICLAALKLLGAKDGTKN
jgi:hypothetical protein